MNQKLEKQQKQKLCLECMECCKTVALPLMGFDSHTNEFLMVRGCETYTTNFGLFVLVPSICPYLTENGCSIYELRPHVCQIYDGTQIPFMKDKCKWKELELDVQET